MDAMTGLTSAIQLENNVPIKVSQSSVNTSESVKSGGSASGREHGAVPEEARQKSEELSETAAQQKAGEVFIDPEGPKLNGIIFQSRCITGANEN